MKERPVGIFDSGIGGLTVLKEIRKVLPEESTVYLGDTARVPYGTKSGETIKRYSLENAGFLLKHGIKLLVVACNTASAYALEELKHNLAVPVIGVILPGARQAVMKSRLKRVGVIGTEGTIKSGAYFDAIKGIDPRVVVFPAACPLFVPLVEEGWTDCDVTRLVVKIYLKDMKKERIDVLLLGCTHYPLLKNAIGEFMGEETNIIDSASATAVEVKRVLSEKGLLNKGHGTTARFFVTDSPERFTNVGAIFLDNGELTKAELVKVDG
ncbi:MAG: glutamate racemase [Deltaproteobacteria bacterium]|nr:glutamate racemase [Deltaproteobacteria bacterium]